LYRAFSFRSMDGLLRAAGEVTAMPLDYAVRATRTMLRHPLEGVERVRGRLDRRRDRHEWQAVGRAPRDFYGPAQNWEPWLHEALHQPWPCDAASAFEDVWTTTVSELTDAGIDVGMFSYARWNDADRSFAAAIWCIVAHLRPARVVETGVAHGLTSRIVLEGLERHGDGRLWSIDLPAADPALHEQIGVAVPRGLHPRWTYIAGTSRERLPGLLAELRQIDLFIHDSLHTGRNQAFELDAAWAALRPGGAEVVDDVDHSLAFRSFADRSAPGASLVAGHVLGDGLWGIAVKR
jgi:hypothetical protein